MFFRKSVICIACYFSVLSTAFVNSTCLLQCINICNTAGANILSDLCSLNACIDITVWLYLHRVCLRSYAVVTDCFNASRPDTQSDNKGKQ
jgi:hypothetical protein